MRWWIQLSVRAVGDPGSKIAINIHLILNLSAQSKFQYSDFSFLSEKRSAFITIIF